MCIQGSAIGFVVVDAWTHVAVKIYACAAVSISHPRNYIIDAKEVPGEPRVIAGPPAGRPARNVSAVRRPALSEPISRAIKASMYRECRASPHWTGTSRFPAPRMT
eukprot:9464542-Pyramimonas_sp.AAC.1